MQNDTFYFSYLFPKEVALQRNNIVLKAKALPSFMSSLQQWQKSRYFSSQNSRHNLAFIEPCYKSCMYMCIQICFILDTAGIRNCYVLLLVNQNKTVIFF